MQNNHISPKEVKKAERDNILAQFLESLNKTDIPDGESKTKLVKQYNQMIDIIYEVDDAAGFGDFQKNQILKNGYKGMERVFGEKKIKATLWAFLAGCLITLIPTFGYMYMMKDKTPEYHWIPNAEAIRKPIYVQVLKTQEDVDNVRQSSIMNAKESCIGCIIQQSKVGFVLYPEDESKLPIYHLTEIKTPQKQEIMNAGYNFIPNAILNKDPFPIQIIQRDIEIESIKKDKNIKQQSLLSIGAGISCLNEKVCFVISKVTLDKEHTIKPLEVPFVETSKK